MRFKQLFKPNVKKLFGNHEAVIEFAFNVGGVDYYQFADVNNTSYKRGLQAVAIYNELDMRCTRDYLMLHTEAMKELLTAKEIDIYAINRINENLISRLSLKTDVDLMYKVASVVYFDKNENPESYDSTYNEKKIAHWKASQGVADFFLSKPLMDLIPYLRNVDTDLNIYSILNEEINKVHELTLNRILSSKKE